MVKFLKPFNGQDHEEYVHTCSYCGDVMRAYILPEAAEELRIPE